MIMTRFFIGVLLLVLSMDAAALEKVNFHQSMGMSLTKKIYLKAFSPAEYELYKKLSQNYYHAIAEQKHTAKIPRTLHFIASENDDNGKFFISQCAQINQEYNIKKWDSSEMESTLKKYRLENIVGADNKINLFKSIILLENGGWFLSDKTSCLKNFNELLSFSFVVGLKEIEDRVMLGTGVLGFEKSSLILKNIIENAQKNGITNFAEQLLEEISSLIDERKKNILVLPSGYFYPFYKKSWASNHEAGDSLGNYYARTDEQNITVCYEKEFSLINYSPFSLELAGGGYIKRYIYELLLGRNENYKLMEKIYNDNFPSIIQFNAQAKIPLTFNVMCFSQTECDQFLGRNLDIIAVNKYHAFQLWHDHLLAPYYNAEKELLAKAIDDETRKKILMLLILYDKGGVFISGKLVSNLNLYELCNKYDLFLALPPLETIFDEILVSSDVVGAKAANIVIKNTIDKLKKSDYIDDRSIRLSLTNSIKENQGVAGRIVIFPGRYFFANQKNRMNFTSFKKIY